jgi:DNA-binding transcriptional MerR regulator
MTPSQRTGRGELTISEFGRRSGLSHKALRLYDLSGLLAPASVDPVNGYRLYDVSQLERARRISVLRQLDMPLATVAETLAGTDEEVLTRLNQWWAAQEATNAARKATLDYLRDRLTHSGDDTFGPRRVTIRDVPATKIAAIRRDADQASLLGVIMGCTRDIRNHLAAAGAERTGESWVIYHGFVTPESAGAVEVCVPFGGSVDPAGPIVIRIEPAHAEAFCTITKDECFYPHILLAYDLVGDWVRRSGLSTTGSVREIYLADFQDLAADEPAVHIAQPVERKAR